MSEVLTVDSASPAVAVKKRRKKSGLPRKPQVRTVTWLQSLIDNQFDLHATEVEIGDKPGGVRQRLRQVSEAYLEKGEDFFGKLRTMFADSDLESAVENALSVVETDMRRGKKSMTLDELFASVDVTFE